MNQKHICHIFSDQSHIQFVFRSTLHAVSGSGNQLSGELFLDENEKITKGFIHIPIGHLQTGHEERDSHMFDMFEKEEYPFIEYCIKQSKKSDTSDRIILQGNLQVRNIVRPLDITAQFGKKDKEWMLKGSFQLSLKDYHLKPPSVLWIIRVFDKIKIDFNAVLRSKKHVTL